MAKTLNQALVKPTFYQVELQPGAAQVYVVTEGVRVREVAWYDFSESADAEDKTSRGTSGC